MCLHLPGVPRCPWGCAASPPGFAQPPWAVQRWASGRMADHLGGRLPPCEAARSGLLRGRCGRYPRPLSHGHLFRRLRCRLSATGLAPGGCPHRPRDWVYQQARLGCCPFRVACLHPVRLDYWIGPGRAGGLGSSLSDHFGRLPARALPAGLPDGADPGSDVQGRRAVGAASRERRAAPSGWPGPLPAGRPAVACGAVAADPPPAMGRGLPGNARDAARLAPPAGGAQVGTTRAAGVPGDHPRPPRSGSS